MKNMAIIILIFMMVTSAFSLFTPFPPVSPPDDTIVTKGGLLTSDGASQVEALACSNTQILEFDSTVSYGFKCSSLPLDTNAATICSSGQILGGAADGCIIPAAAGANTTLSNLTGNTSINQNLYFSGYRQVGASATPIGYLRSQAVEINTGSSPKYTIEGGSYSQDGLTYSTRFQNYPGTNAAFQSKSESTLKTNDIYFLSGEISGAAAITNTGDIKVHTGDNKGEGHTGSLSLKSGDNAKAVTGVGNSGAVIIASGDILNAGTGTSGNVEITAGASAGTRGSIIIDTAIDKAVLATQPTGAVPLAIATTQYVDDNAGGGDTFGFVNAATNTFVNAVAASTNALAGTSVSFTTNATSNPVELYISGQIGGAVITGSAGADFKVSCAVNVKRGATTVDTSGCILNGTTNSVKLGSIFCAVRTMTDSTSTANTTYTYSLELQNASTGTGATYLECDLLQSFGGDINFIVRQAP